MSSNIVDEIKSRCDIVDVISRYITVKRAGSAYKASCPFHNEKTPSFTINQDRQTFKCFGCGEGGDVIKFVQLKENLDFREAVTKLADMYGIDTSGLGKGYSRGSRVIYDINREAAMFYLRNLRENKGRNPCFEYFRRRGLNADTMTRFGLGYAKDSWDDLIVHLTSKGFRLDDIVSAGLAVRKENGRCYNKFRNRGMFPIINVSGKVIGFGGRDLGDRGPKYLNSPESSVFIKGNNLFGLNLTRNDINSAGTAILVEGNMDMVSLYHNGVRNVAASLGTALTENQCKLLKRFADTVILAYDSDAAGRKAALKGIEVIKKAGLKAKVMHVTDGKDPDEFIRKHGREAFMELADRAASYTEYKIDHLRSIADMSSPEGRLDFLHMVKSQVFKGMDPAETEAYSHQLADMTGISEAAINRTMADDTFSPPDLVVYNERPRSGGSGQPGQTGDIRMQRRLLRILMQDPAMLERVRLCDTAFEDPLCRRIYDVFTDKILSGSSIAGDMQDDISAMVLDDLEPDGAALFEDIKTREIFPRNMERELEEFIETLDKKRTDRRIAEITSMLDHAGEEDRDALMKELNGIYAARG